MDFMNESDQFNAIQMSADFISMFTDWQEMRMTSMIVGSKYEQTDMGYEQLRLTNYIDLCEHQLLGGKLVKRVPVVPNQSLDNSIDSGAGLWYNKIYNFGKDHSPSGPIAGKQMHSEFYVPQ